MREWIFALLLLAACVLIAVGVAMWSIPAGLITAGVLLASWAVLVIIVGEAGVPADTADDAGDVVPEVVL